MDRIPFCVVSAFLTAALPAPSRAADGAEGVLLLASSDRRITSQSATAMRQQPAIRVQPQSQISKSTGSTVQTRPLNPAIRNKPGANSAPGSVFMMQKARELPPVAEPDPPGGAFAPGGSRRDSFGASAPFGNPQPTTFAPAAGGAAPPATASLLDVFAGREILARLDPADKSIVGHTAKNALENFEDNTVVSWASPVTGNKGTVTTLRTFKLSDWTPCRDYQMTLTVAGRSETASGSACRGGDGAWQARR